MTDSSDQPGAICKGSANDVACWDCADHATERLEEMFVDLIQRERIARGQTPARRTVFLKQHGAAYGWLSQVVACIKLSLSTSRLPRQSSQGGSRSRGYGVFATERTGSVLVCPVRMRDPLARACTRNSDHAAARRAGWSDRALKSLNYRGPDPVP